MRRGEKLLGLNMHVINHILKQTNTTKDLKIIRYALVIFIIHPTTIAPIKPATIRTEPKVPASRFLLHCDNYYIDGFDLYVFKTYE